LPSGPFHTKRWAGYFLAVGGIAMIAAGIWHGAESMDFLGTAARTDGTVIALKRERGAKGMALDHPVVRFTPPESSETIEFKSRFGIRPSPFAVGDPVEVAYDPADPSGAKIDSFWTIWFLPILLALFGLACLVAGYHTLHKTKSS